jgi:hypothetical protein
MQVKHDIPLLKTRDMINNLPNLYLQLKLHHLKVPNLESFYLVWGCVFAILVGVVKGYTKPLL